MSLPLSSHWKRLGIVPPSLHVVLGSGLNSALDSFTIKDGWKERGEIPFSEVEGLFASSVFGHKGTYKYYEHVPSKKILCLQAGRLHGYEGHSPRDVVKTVLLPMMAGTKKFLLTNAAGSLKKEFSPGSLMILTDHVNMTGTSPLYGPNPSQADGKALGPRFPDMSEVYSKKMRERLRSSLAAPEHGLKVVEGVYLGLLGPAYETPTEVKLYASWGLQAVGMSTVWEAMALRHAGAELAGLSFISNLGCGLGDEPLSHEEVEREGKKVASRLLPALFNYAEKELT